MPIRVSASTDLGLVLVVFDGVVTADELERDLVPLIDQPGIALLRSMLLDMTTAARGDAPSELIRRYARHVGERIDEQIEFGSKVALVATNPEFFGLSRMYQTLRSDSPVAVEIFHSRGEAEAWLELPDDYAAQLTDIVR